MMYKLMEYTWIETGHVVSVTFSKKSAEIMMTGDHALSVPCENAAALLRVAFGVDIDNDEELPE